MEQQLMQLEFNNFVSEKKEHKSYRAIRHDVVRFKQKENCVTVHHPEEKIDQILRVIAGFHKQQGHEILELFSGRGNLTKVYERYGKVSAYDKKYLKTGDSYREYHKLIYEKKKYTIIDLDPYGFPNRFFPEIYLLIDDGLLFLTMPKPYVNILNGITKTHLISYFGEPNPDEETIVERIANWGLCHWREVSLIESLDLKSIWRMCFYVKKVKATEYTGVKNR